MTYSHLTHVSGCYALQQILEGCFGTSAPDLVLLDRGLFDAAAWMELLCSQEKRIDEEDRDIITSFLMHDLWQRRENAVFLFTADYDTSLKRENHDQLTTKPGLVMNPQTLQRLDQAYRTAAKRLSATFGRVYHIDTSFGDNPPSFQQIAFIVAERIVDLMNDLSTQEVLVTDPVSFDGFSTDRDVVEATAKGIVQAPAFSERMKAEQSLKVQQIVPYAVLQNDQHRYFWARRGSEVRRKELRRKYTILVGGHAEKRDWNDEDPGGVFERCIRRELEEELAGIRVIDVKPLGFIHDVRNEMGSRHLAFIHEVSIGGRAAIRRQAIDQEFGREAISWRTADEIRQAVGDLDPWSQLVAAHLFAATVPTTGTEPTLFTEPT